MLFVRKEAPPQQRKYQDYKAYLRRDFLYRCAYCLIHEGHFGGLRNYHVDHFCPKRKFPGLALVYKNLYYSCSICNTVKGDVWPSQDQLSTGYCFTDPCQENPYEHHFHAQGNGILRFLTNAGKYTLEHLRLNRQQLVNHRRRQTDVLEKCREVRDLVDSLSIRVDLAKRIREQLEQIERFYTDPPIPYEPENLLPS